MNVYVYPTDRDWYEFLSRKPSLDEVNFWRPGGKQRFGALSPGDLLLFRLGKPDNAIAGGGVYTHFSFAPLFQAWDAFGEKNGSSSYSAFLELVARHRKFEGNAEQIATAVIGCIVLTAPFFLPRERWFPVPPECEVQVLRDSDSTRQESSDSVFSQRCRRPCASIPWLACPKAARTPFNSARASLGAAWGKVASL